MNITLEELADLADFLDANGECKAAEQVDLLIKKEAEKRKSINIGVVFEKLAVVADELDSAGAIKEANLIDDFISKQSAQFGDPFTEEESSMPRCEVCANPKVGEVCDYCGAGLFDDENTKQDGDSDEKHDIDAAKKDILNKQAEDVVKWQSEGKTDQSKRYDEKEHHKLLVREPKRKQERVDREKGEEHHVKNYKQTGAPSLSHRYCPDHVGVQLGRVGEGVFQCPLDNVVYNWEAGFTDANGVEYPGGSVAGQTPDSTGYEIPHRVFDSRL